MHISDYEETAHLEISKHLGIEFRFLPLRYGIRQPCSQIIMAFAVGQIMYEYHSWKRKYSVIECIQPLRELRMEMMYDGDRRELVRLVVQTEHTGYHSPCTEL